MVNWAVLPYFLLIKLMLAGGLLVNQMIFLLKRHIKFVYSCCFQWQWINFKLILCLILPRIHHLVLLNILILFEFKFLKKLLMMLLFHPKIRWIFNYLNSLILHLQDESILTLFIFIILLKFILTDSFQNSCLLTQ